jgi:hypothetical protein
MKLQIKILLVAIACIWAMAGCKQNFLEITPTDRLSDDAVLGDSTLFEDYIINCYVGVKLQDKEGEGTPPGFGRGFEYSMWASVTDESIYTNDDNSWLIQRGQIAPENTGIAGTIWGRSYRSIREINYALAHINDVEMSDQLRSELTGELKFLRAFRYFDLIRNYGQVVLVGDRVYSLGDDFSDTDSLYDRASIKDGVDYTVAQLDEAAALLPGDHSGSWQLGRATQGAALALKSRLLLYAASPLYDAATWQQAADAANAVIQLHKYSLFRGGYDQLFLTPENNPEIIFERLYTHGARHVCMEIANGPNGYDAWGGNTPLQNLVDDYEMSNGKPITDPASGYDPTHPYKNRDPRFYQTILYNGAPYRGDTVWTYTPGGKDSKDGPSNWNTSKTGYYLKKFMDDNLPIENPWDVAGTQPWIYFRYAEILLNYAEAENEAAGPDGSVYDAINQVRARAGMPDLPSGLSQTAMRKRIWNERRVELAFEEDRYYDVRRWKIADSVENVPAYGITITKSGNTYSYAAKVALDGRHFEDKQYWLPIPRAEIQASDNKLKQNPGYQ